MLGSWDVSLFRAINEGWGGPALDPFFWFFSSAIKTWPLRLFLAGLFIALLGYGVRTRAAAVQAVIAFPLSNSVSDVFKNLLQGARPASELENVRVVSQNLAHALQGVPGEAMTSYGTMSAHAANMAAVATVFFFRLGWKWGVGWIAVALLTGLSRVYVGAHYPSQVLIGWLGGFTCAFVVVKTWDAFVATRTPKQKAP